MADPIPVAAPLPTRQQAIEYATSLTTVNPTAVPPDLLTQEDMVEWFETAKQLADLKSKEMLLRLKIFKHYFPTPVEGTNSVSLPDGYIVKGVFKIQRDIDPAALEALQKLTVGDAYEMLKSYGMVVEGVDPALPLLAFMKLSPDKLVKYDPALAIKEYRALTEEQRRIFEQCMVIKAGSPSLAIAPPTAKSAAAVAAK